MKIRYFIPICLCALAASGCSKELSSNGEPSEIIFDAQLAEMTKAGLFSAANLDALNEFVATGYDGDTKTIDAVTVKKNSGSVWKFTGSTKLWASGHTMTFWASANIETGFSVTTSSKASATLTVTSIAAAAASHSDPLIGYYTGKGNNGCAPLTFYHPLTAVRFVKGSSGTPAKITSISGVEIDGVYVSGTATVTGGSSSLGYSWTSRSGSQTVSGSFSGTESAAAYILIPQDLATQNVTLKIHVTHADKGNITLTAPLTSGSWEAGKLNTYTLDYANDKMVPTLTVSLNPWGTVVNTEPDPDVNYFDANFD